MRRRATRRSRPCWARSTANGAAPSRTWHWDGAGHREPGVGDDRGLGVLQRHRRRAPDPHPRDAVRGREPAAIDVDKTRDGRRRSRLGTAPAGAGETGFKDTVIAYPGEVTRVRAQFDTPGQYVWHCHIVEHEDNEMMRPYRIGPVQPGQPGGLHPTTDAAASGE